MVLAPSCNEMLRLGIIFVVLVMPVSVAAEPAGHAKDGADSLMHLRMPRLDVGLLSFEATTSTSATFGLFAAAIKDSNEGCPPR